MIKLFAISVPFIIFIILKSEVMCQKILGNNLRRERRGIARNQLSARMQILRDAAKLEERLRKFDDFFEEGECYGQ